MRIILIALFTTSLMGQGVTTGAGVSMGRGVGSFASMSLGVHGFTDNGASTATSVAVAIGTPAAGSTIYCDIRYPNGSTFTTVTDNCNSGNYQPLLADIRPPGGTTKYATYYKENVAACSTTVTAAWTTTGTNGQIHCKEIKGGRATFAADTSVAQSVSTTSTNPANTNSYTPYGDNEMVLSGGLVSSGTVTAGSGFTLLDASSAMNPEYQIQATKTATTGQLTDSTSTGYAIGMAAFAPDAGGPCDITGLIDWSGGSNGATVAASDAQTSAHGLNSQGTSIFSHFGAFVVASGAGLTYNTAAYQPLATSRNCPFYSGSGTGTLGLDHASNTAGGVQYWFITQQPNVTAAACISTTAPTGLQSGYGLDTMSIHGGFQGNGDYVNLQWNSSSNKWALEAPGGSAGSTTTWLQNTQYWILLTYKQQGRHTISIYQGCGANPTLQETITATGVVSGGGFADVVNFGNSGNDTWPSSYHWYYGAAIVDILYGGTLLP